VLERVRRDAEVGEAREKVLAGLGCGGSQWRSIDQVERKPVT
jgi:hypothetical protein